jgi:ribose transport system substrate-binding protein
MRGLGPHGERAAPADKLALTTDEVTAARAGRFTAGIILHTVTSDWARLVAAGIGETFAAHSGAVVEIVDCSFDKTIQNRELSRLAQSRIDAVISVPVGVSGLSHAYREVSKAGKKLILIDNAPAGMLPGAEYVAVVSTDNFNLGEIAAALLSPHVANEGVAGILTYSADFFAANEREIAFRKWIGANRPDPHAGAGTLRRGRGRRPCIQAALWRKS